MAYARLQTPQLILPIGSFRPEVDARPHRPSIEMQARRDEYITQPFVLDQANMQRLVEAFASFVGPTTITYRCADKIERDFSTVADALAYENVPGRAVLSLSLRAHSEDWRASASLRFDGDAQRNIRLDIQGSEDTVIGLNEAVSARLSAMRPWYWPVSRTSTFIVLWLSFVFFSAVIPLFRYFVIQGGSAAALNSGKVSMLAIVLGMLFGAGLVLIAQLLDRLKLRVFPMAVFAVGQGLKRHSDMEIVRTVFVAAFVVSSLSGVVTTALL